MPASWCWRGCSTEDAQALAGLLQQSMAAVHLAASAAVGRGSAEEVRTRVAVGLSSLQAGHDSPETLMERAQQALAAGQPNG